MWPQVLQPSAQTSFHSNKRPPSSPAVMLPLLYHAIFVVVPTVFLLSTKAWPFATLTLQFIDSSVQ